jgi:simple sugar transport system permease protein
MIRTILTMAAPLTFAALGGLYSETAGSLAVFLEGFMVIGSFIAWTVGHATGSWLIGAAAAALLSGSVGWLLASFTRRSGANPFIIALALNLAASGAVDAVSAAWYGTKGVLSDPNGFEVGPLPSIIAACAAVVATALILNRTRMGLRLRAVGVSPEAATDRGIRAGRYVAGAWCAAAALAALGGAAITFRVGAYSPGGIAGRGWISIAIVYLGFRNAWGVAAAAVFFAAAEYAANAAQGTVGTFAVPATVLLGLPPALAFLLFSVSSALRKKRIDT